MANKKKPKNSARENVGMGLMTAGLVATEAGTGVGVTSLGFAAGEKGAQKYNEARAKTHKKKAAALKPAAPPEHVPSPHQPHASIRYMQENPKITQARKTRGTKEWHEKKMSQHEWNARFAEGRVKPELKLAKTGGKVAAVGVGLMAGGAMIHGVRNAEKGRGARRHG